MSSKMREALSDACYAMFNFLKTQYGCRYEEMAKALDKAKAALAEPLKNYEVGTIEEQRKRFHREYYSKHSKCRRRWSIAESALDWSQMQYEKEGEE